MRGKKKIMRNTKAKRMRNYLESMGYEYVSCKKLDNLYQVMAYETKNDKYLRFMVAFANSMIIIQSMEVGNIQFTPEGEPIKLMEVVEG